MGDTCACVQASACSASGALPCRFMDMESFALEAEAKAAVVLVALQGGAQANGEVQKYLEAHRIPFTGPNWQSAHLAANQVLFSHRPVSWGCKTPCVMRDKLRLSDCPPAN